MATKLTQRQKRELESGGALVLDIPLQTQPKGTYWNKYGEPLYGLPCDAWSLVHYLRRGLLLQKPERPKKRPQTAGVGVADWDGRSKQGTPEDAAQPAGPTATYYTADGTAVPNLPADPASMAAYIANGLTLSAPAGVAAPTPIDKAPSRRSRAKKATA